MRPLFLLSFLLPAACGDKDEVRADERTARPGGDLDADGDGFAGSEDCDDNDATVNPDATEICDTVDNDCDGLVDDDDDSVDLGRGDTWYPDVDGDGFGALEGGIQACRQPSGRVAVGGDCDDSDAAVSPGATEVCDDADLDEDCSGAADDADPGVDPTTQTRTHPDADADGFGDATDPGRLSCEPPPDEVTDNSDCDDDNALVNPAAMEVCDDADVDEDCSGAADDADRNADPATQTRGYPDADGDGYGNADTRGVLYCDFPTGVVSDNSDCDDGVAAVNPAAVEVCDDADVDEDCSGAADDADAGVDPRSRSTFYDDVDQDGYGDARAPLSFCDAPVGAVSDDTDCDDDNANSFPGAVELCDGQDNDCDGDSSDVGLVSFEDVGGVWTSLTGVFSAGTASSPVSWVSSAAGTLWLCNDTFYATLEAAHDLNLHGYAGDEVLDGAATSSVLSIETDGIAVSVQDLTLQNGLGDRAILAAYGYSASGGGIACAAAADLTLDGVTLSGNVAPELGGGLAAEGCTVDLYDSAVLDNAAEYGGGLLVVDSTVTVTDSRVEGNIADDDGGGLLLVDATVSLEDTLVTANEAADAAGGALVQTLSGSTPTGLSCTGSTAATAGVTANTADRVGGIYLTDSGASFQATDCDLGTWSGGDANEPHALANETDGYVFGSGNDATFTCASGSCGTSTSEDLGSTVVTPYSGASRYRGNVFLASDFGTIDRFSMDLDADSSCVIDQHVASNASLQNAGWTVEWSSTGNSPLSDGSVSETDDIGLAMEPGRYYAVFSSWNCSTTGDIVGYSLSPYQHNDVALGTHVGYLQGSHTASLSGTGVTLGVTVGATQYYGTLDLTDL